MKAPRIRRVLAGLVVGGLVLGAVEAGVRVAAGPPPPPVRVYTVVPPGDGAFVSDGTTVRPTYISLDPPPPLVAEPTGERWIALGASSVHGGTPGVSRAREFPALAGAVAGVEVLNLATPGLDSYDLVNLVGQLDVLNPTGVIVYEGHNDVGNAWFQQRFGTPAALAEARVGALLSRSRLFLELRRALVPVEGRGRVPRVQGDRPGGLSAETRERAEVYFATNLRRIAWRCARAGWKLVLVTPVSNVLAEPARLGGGENDAAADRWARGQALLETDPAGAVTELRAARDADVIGLRASTRTQEDVRAVAAETGALLLDAERALPREPGLDVPAATLFGARDPLHLSAKGHVAMGALVAEAIAAR